jgi:hypothetical protein
MPSVAVWAAVGVTAAVAIGLLAWLLSARRPAPAGAGWHRCRRCRGSGALPDPTTRTGFALCEPCNGTGWTQD